MEDCALDCAEDPPDTGNAHVPPTQTRPAAQRFTRCITAPSPQQSTSQGPPTPEGLTSIEPHRRMVGYRVMQRPPHAGAPVQGSAHPQKFVPLARSMQHWGAPNPQDCGLGAPPQMAEDAEPALVTAQGFGLKSGS